MSRLSLLAALLGCLLCACQPVDTTGLDEAMQGYLDSIHDLNPGLTLRYMPRTDKWHFISYRKGNSKIVSAPFFTYQETQTQFDRRGGLWTALFSGTDDYHYTDRIAAHPTVRYWDHDPGDLTYRIPARDGVSYVTWRKEGDGWVISAIGDDAP
ncbi:MAG: hypothetical protein PW734_04725 [Verrucomicrobium sp.]|nr:hypothetical protein [Verrucomicrobium sp.]